MLSSGSNLREGLAQRPLEIKPEHLLAVEHPQMQRAVQLAKESSEPYGLRGAFLRGLA
jgi:hypothetical protein